ncbi:hypothetical protein ABKA04_006934 [Annulohypoxylon sp. FPYF3050]
MESTAKVPETSLWANRKCLLICAIVAIANMQYGLDSAAIGSLQAMPGFLEVFGYKDPTQPSGYAIEASSLYFDHGAFLSSLVAGSFAHFFGRKVALWLACILNAIACIIQISTTDKAAVYVGRLVLGLANGFLTSEAAPAHLRAVMVALFSEWVNIGSIIGAAVTNATKNRLDKASYQIPLGTLFIVPAFLAVGLFFVPESPRYLLYKGKIEEARQSLQKLRGDSLSPDGFELEWVEMVKGIEEEKHTANTIGPLDMFKENVGTELRRTLLCYGIIATQTGAGSWFIISYSTYFMTVAGLSTDDAFKFSVMHTCLGFIGVNIGMYLMRHIMGRRSVLMTGAAAQGLAMLGMAISATVAYGTVSARNCVIAFTALYQFSYNAFVGDATYPTATEMGAKYAYIWAGSNLCCLVFFYICVPETKGRTLEEIDELFAKRVSVRNFKNFKTKIVAEALRDVKGRIPESEKLATIEHIDKV